MRRVAIANRVRCLGPNPLLQTALEFKHPRCYAFNTPQTIALRGLSSSRKRDQNIRSVDDFLSVSDALGQQHASPQGNNGRENNLLSKSQSMKPDQRDRPYSGNYAPVEDSGESRDLPTGSPSSPRLASRQRWTKGRRRKPRETQLLHLRNTCDGLRLPAAEAELQDWALKYDNFIASKDGSDLPEFVEAGKWLCCHDTTTSMHEAWMALDEEDRRKQWVDVMMATLHHSPDKATSVLTATFEPLPPEYAVNDVLLFIARRQSAVLFDSMQHRIASANQIVELLEKVLLHFPKNNFFFSQESFGRLADHLPCEYVVEIYEMLGRANIEPSFHTSMHFARRLAAEPKYKRRALGILNGWLKYGASHPAMQSAITSLLSYMPSEDDGASSESALTPAEALQSLVERNYVPNLINLTAGLDGLCQYGEFEEATRLALLFAQENVELDGKAGAKLFKGAKFSLRAKNMRKAFEMSKMTKMPAVDVLNRGLHAIYFFAAAESRDNGHGPPWMMPIFWPMLHIYSQRFQLGPLQAWFSSSLPFMLMGQEPAMDHSKLARWPLLYSVLLEVEGFFYAESMSSNKKLSPNADTIAIMLRAYIKSLQDPDDILRFYKMFKSQLQEGGPRSIFARLIAKKGSLIHDTLIRALMERPWSARAGLQIFGDMLQDHAKMLEEVADRGEKRDKDSMLPLHPPPSRFTFAIVINGLMGHGSVTLAEQMVKLMQEHGIQADLAVWNTLIKGHAKAQNFDKTVATLREVEAAGLGMNNKTFKAFGHLRNQEAAFRAMERIIEKNMQSMLA